MTTGGSLAFVMWNKYTMLLQKRRAQAPIKRRDFFFSFLSFSGCDRWEWVDRVWEMVFLGWDLVLGKEFVWNIFSKIL